MALPFISRLIHSRGAPLDENAPPEELVLVLSRPERVEHEGEMRPAATARLVYRPAAPDGAEVSTGRAWRFVAPPAPVGEGDLRWYLEKYVLWPGGPFRRRARSVEEGLVRWGRALHEAALPADAAPVLRAWTAAGTGAPRRFTIEVAAGPEPGATPVQAVARREAAAELLALPWELLHDRSGYLFHGRRPVRVRRSLAGAAGEGAPVPGLPIRILLVSARPEDEACAYFDHRVSALPLVQAMEALPGVVRIHVLDPPTFPALLGELHRARAAGEPYHVLHFDGHGSYDAEAGMGALCFEHPDDDALVEGRGHATVSADELVPRLREYRIPLVFLEACQTAQGRRAAGSVASALLEAGVPSIVAMSHSVLVETSRRFVETFYATLSGGGRVGDAMLAGQRRLKEDPSRGAVLGAGELRLEDWFVPVLFQGGDDPRLFAATTTAVESREAASAPAMARLHGFPPEPSTGFVGRSRELLALQRLLRQERYAVVVGQGGEGKTELAAELARWLVRSQQIERAVFVSVETHGHAAAVLDAVGSAILSGYSVATFADFDAAVRPVEDALAEAPTLLVVDNLESVLPPPWLAEETPDVLAEENRQELDAILGLCARLASAGETRIVFTSRELLPPPFDAVVNRRELGALALDDAVLLVERALNAETGNGNGAVEGAAREEIEELVEAVHGHARTLALLAPSLRARGVAATRASLAELMAEMDRAFPGSRERSLFASVELSLRRLSPENRERVRALAPFQGVADLAVVSVMMEWEIQSVLEWAADLVRTGLATRDYYHVILDPALCPYLRTRLSPEDRAALSTRWREATIRYARHLLAMSRSRSEMAAHLTALDLPNLLALLGMVIREGDPQATIAVATDLHVLVHLSGRPRLLARIERARDEAATVLGEGWSSSAFEVWHTRIGEQISGGDVAAAVKYTAELLEQARAAADRAAYAGADYDLALAVLLRAEALQRDWRPAEALALADEARERFEALAAGRNDGPAATMACNCLDIRGDCLLTMGQLDGAAAAYQENIRRNEVLQNERGAAAGRAALGIVRMQQQRGEEALGLLSEAAEAFARLDEPRNLATTRYHMGIVLQEMERVDAAEDAYRGALAIVVRVDDPFSQADILHALANLYAHYAARAAEAVPLYEQAITVYEQSGDRGREGIARTNLAETLRQLGRLDEARDECLRALHAKSSLDDPPEPWSTWSVLSSTDADAGRDGEAATARRTATELYLAYRRAGGVDPYAEGQLASMVTSALRLSGPAAAAGMLDRVEPRVEGPQATRFVRALRQIAFGSRDRSLADDPELGYATAAEILYLIETLESGG